MADSSVPITAGAGTNIDTVTAPSGDHRQVVIVGNRGSYTGRCTTNRTPGRAATSHKIGAIFNAAGSTVRADVTFVGVDTYQTVIKAVTVPPPILRVSRITAVPTNGTAGSKVAEDTGNTSSTSVTTWQDASADGTSSAVALTATVAAGNGVTQEFIPRMITGAGYEMADRMEFLSQSPITLRAGEGLAVELISPAGTSEPVTDMFIVSLRWEEYTP